MYVIWKKKSRYAPCKYSIVGSGPVSFFFTVQKIPLQQYVYKPKLSSTNRHFPSTSLM